MLNRPAYISESVTRAPLDFAWSNAIDSQLDDFDAVPRRLGAPLSKISYRGRMALATACLEWVFWRLSGWTDVRDGLQRIEAAWASQVSLDYTRGLDLENINDEDTGPGNPAGPLQAALMRLEMLHLYYSRGKTEMGSNSGRCALLASHVLPKDCGFEPWLAEVLTAMAVTDPCSPDFDLKRSKFDYSAEAPVPRAWFEKPSAPRDPGVAKSDWNAFLASLDPSTNPYLVPAEEMSSNGFSGKPYTLV